MRRAKKVYSEVEINSIMTLKVILNFSHRGIFQGYYFVKDENKLLIYSELFSLGCTKKNRQNKVSRKMRVKKVYL